MTIREGRWDCPACGALGNPGRQIHCPSCALPRPKDIRFYLPDDADVVTDDALLARGRAGADWVCEHCAASNADASAMCTGCGAPRGSSPRQSVRDHALGAVPRDGGRRAPPQTALAAPPKKRARRLPWVVLAIALLGMIGWWNAPVEREVTVAGKEWRRTIAVEAYRTVREEDWSVPTGGRIVRQWRDIRSYNRVLDHYETRTRQVDERVQVGTESYSCGQRDRGNGFFEEITCERPVYETRSRTETYEEPIYRQEPVYDTKFSYDVERWVPADTARAQGDTAAPAWPTLRLGENQREGERTELYRLEMRDEKGRTYADEVPLAEFEKRRMGSSARVRMRRSGGDVEFLATS